MKGWIILSLRLSHLCGKVQTNRRFQILKKKFSTLSSLHWKLHCTYIFNPTIFSLNQSISVPDWQAVGIWLGFCRNIRIESKIVLFWVISFKFKKWPRNIFKPLHEIVLDHEFRHNLIRIMKKIISKFS